MKQILLIIFLAIGINAQAQTKKADVIYKTNGEELSIEVKEVSDDAVRFTYPGETSVYTIKKNEIQKIAFGSGRIETFADNEAPPASNNTAITKSSHGNKVAIIPFAFLADGQNIGQEASQRVQNECYTFLSKHAGDYNIMDVRTTNAMLNKAGITQETMGNYTMDQICDALGVAFVITGMVTVDRTSQSSYGSNAQSSNYKKNADRNKGSTTTYGSSYSTTEQNYSTNVELDIYDDSGKNVYSQNRNAFWHQQDAYKNTIEYLLKRSPLYKK